MSLYRQSSYNCEWAQPNKMLRVSIRFQDCLKHVYFHAYHIFYVKQIHSLLRMFPIFFIVTVQTMFILHLPNYFQLQKIETGFVRNEFWSYWIHHPSVNLMWRRESSKKLSENGLTLEMSNNTLGYGGWVQHIHYI